MSEHKATIDWRRETADFAYETYGRDHDWSFDGGTTVRASAAPEYKGSAARVNPEEAFVASLSSCHMLTFLAVAARRRYVVERYRDEAVGVLDKNAEGRMAVTRATLRPKVEFSGDRIPTAEELKALHESAHHHCFIANSVKTEITVEPQ